MFSHAYRLLHAPSPSISPPCAQLLLCALLFLLMLFVSRMPLPLCTAETACSCSVAILLCMQPLLCVLLFLVMLLVSLMMPLT